MNEHALSRRPELLVAAAGLSVGVATAIGQTYLDGALNALVNSVSAWLVAAFLVGSTMRTDRGAAVAGLCVCALQLVGYYVVAELRGFPLGGPALIVFWFGCAVVGGPVFGLAGRRWRLESPRGLGAADPRVGVLRRRPLDLRPRATALRHGRAVAGDRQRDRARAHPRPPLAGADRPRRAGRRAAAQPAHRATPPSAASDRRSSRNRRSFDRRNMPNASGARKAPALIPRNGGVPCPGSREGGSYRRRR